MRVSHSLILCAARREDVKESASCPFVLASFAGWFSADSARQCSVLYFVMFFACIDSVLDFLHTWCRISCWGEERIARARLMVPQSKGTSLGGSCEFYRCSSS